MDNMFLHMIIAFYNQAKAYATKGLSKKADKVAGATQGGTAVFDAEGNASKNKMSKKDIYSQNAALNAARRAKSKSRG